MRASFQQIVKINYKGFDMGIYTHGCRGLGSQGFKASWDSGVWLNFGSRNEGLALEGLRLWGLRVYGGFLLGALVGIPQSRAL